MTEAQMTVLRRGYCILYLDYKPGVDVPYRTWSGLIDRGWTRHQQSNLDAKRPWERYVITPAGRTALQEAERTDG